MLFPGRVLQRTFYGGRRRQSATLPNSLSSMTLGLATLSVSGGLRYNRNGACPISRAILPPIISGLDSRLPDRMACTSSLSAWPGGSRGSPSKIVPTLTSSLKTWRGFCGSSINRQLSQMSHRGANARLERLRQGIPRNPSGVVVADQV